MKTAHSLSGLGSAAGILLGLVLLMLPAGCAPRPAPAAGRQRHFQFHYGVTLDGLSADQPVRLWLPLAHDGPHQQVRVLSIEAPGEPRETVEARYGNHLLYVEAPADPRGELHMQIDYEVTRHEVLPSGHDALPPDARQLFLAANAMVPVDAPEVLELMGKTETQGTEQQIARRFYDLVGQELRYDKPEGAGWGRGDARWACSARFGNCTDYHSLFISMCRSRGIPARFEIGFPLPAGQTRGEVAGYHCWAWFGSGDHWTACDISEADKHPELRRYYFGSLSPDRVAFSVGRDLLLEPPQSAGPVNYLIYPYAEVDGRPWPHTSSRFWFEDL